MTAAHAQHNWISSNNIINERNLWRRRRRWWRQNEREKLLCFESDQSNWNEMQRLYWWGFKRVTFKESNAHKPKKCTNFKYIEPSLMYHTTYTVQCTQWCSADIVFEVWIYLYFFAVHLRNQTNWRQASEYRQQRNSNNKKYLVPHGNGSMCVVYGLQYNILISWKLALLYETI